MSTETVAPKKPTRDVRSKEMDLVHAKLSVSGEGQLEGYASVFNVVDSYGDSVVPGAYKKTIKERVSSGKVALMSRHAAYGGDVSDIVGTITEAVEDDYGLKISATFSGVTHAQEVRQLVNEGHLSGLSIGYAVIQESNRPEDGVNLLEEIALYEITLTPFPANDDSRVLSSKSDKSLSGETLSAEEMAERTSIKAALTETLTDVRRRLRVARMHSAFINN